MNKKLVRLIALILTAFTFNGCAHTTTSSAPSNSEQNPNGGEIVHKIEQEYFEILNNPEKLPVSFVYEDTYYTGLSPRHFKQVSQTAVSVDGGVKHTTVYDFSNLKVTLVSAVYPEYSAYDYTLYFSNKSSKNSGVSSKISQSCCAKARTPSSTAG